MIKNDRESNDSEKQEQLSGIKKEKEENFKQIDKILLKDFKQIGETEFGESGDCAFSRFIQEKQIVDISDCSSSNNGFSITIFNKIN